MAEVIIGTTKVLTLVGGTATHVTTDLLVKTVSFTASNVYYLGSTIFSTSKTIGIKELEQVENEIDLLETIKIYESWIIEMCEKKSDIIEQSKTLKMSIESINNVLEQLHDLLKQIEVKVQYHQSKWFNSWRSLDFTTELNELKLKKSLLDNRFNILQKIKLDI